jgi:hypothetical protein
MPYSRDAAVGLPRLAQPKGLRPWRGPTSADRMPRGQFPGQASVEHGPGFGGTCTVEHAPGFSGGCVGAGVVCTDLGKFWEIVGSCGKMWEIAEHRPKDRRGILQESCREIWEFGSSDGIVRGCTNCRVVYCRAVLVRMGN